eukprot:gnl/TRDRNA2_/TRDRNA2_173101_c0_seq2.p2 gnl/TRDRNA2_/TRDRNA2_173101_c0~~gnl/TRDRNA2_/TRDRNA2_173101_c0_seq2.p2  ORF type:complete len:217 (-),score=15.48 gnl/TRDRNA2_/TRDRNA2_173101_c0_seq2:82-732(-)
MHLSSMCFAKNSQPPQLSEKEPAGRSGWFGSNCPACRGVLTCSCSDLCMGVVGSHASCPFTLPITGFSALQLEITIEDDSNRSPSALQEHVMDCLSSDNAQSLHDLEYVPAGHSSHSIPIKLLLWCSHARAPLSFTMLLHPVTSIEEGTRAPQGFVHSVHESWTPSAESEQPPQLPEYEPAGIPAWLGDNAFCPPPHPACTHIIVDRWVATSKAAE